MKLYAGLLTIALLCPPHAGFATVIIRQANAKISVIKTTMTKVNGRYQRTDSRVCSEQVPVPVSDSRIPGPDLSKYWGESNCESTIKNKPVVINTKIFTMLVKMNSLWEVGKVSDFKAMFAGSYVYSKNRDLSPDLIQGNLYTKSFTEDLNLQTIGFELLPDIQTSSGSCSAEKGKPTPPCPIDEKVNFEEYFSVYVYIEDKN